MAESEAAGLPATALVDWLAITAIAIAFAAAASFAYSIDLPEGTARWSRLTPG